MKEKKVRWWPAVIVLVLNVLITAWIWWVYDSIRQNKVTNTFLLEFITVLLLLVWMLFFSGLKLKIRLACFTVVVFSITLFFTLFQVREVSGDLMPIFEWRWERTADDHRLNTRAQADISSIAIAIDRISYQDYPQFLGLKRNAVVEGIELVQDWESQPPKEIWKQTIGAGWSAFAVKGNLAITQEQQGEQEMVVCYELKTGRVLWTHSDKARFETVIGGIGPRATPTIVADRVYSLGATGILNCLDLKSGGRLWSTNILEENNAKMPEWGVSCSPLLLDSLVVVCPGGREGRSLAAYHKDSGEIIWTNDNAKAGYSSPMIATIADSRQILIFNKSHVAAHQPITGEILWNFPWPGGTQIVAQPVVLPGNRVLISTGYGVGSKLLKIQKQNSTFTPSLLWESKRLKAKFTNVVHRDGFVYGLDDGILVCIDLINGERRWKRGRYGHGQLILVGALLLISTEKGDIALVRASPEGYNEVAYMPAIEGKTWNNPALAAPYLLVRNSEEAACYELSLLRK